MLRMCVYMHSRFVKNHPIQILEDGPLISEVVLSQVGYSESEVDTDMAGLKLEMDTVASNQVVSHEISNQENYSAD
jgi:hypothetical protein